MKAKTQADLDRFHKDSDTPFVIEKTAEVMHWEFGRDFTEWSVEDYESLLNHFRKLEENNAKYLNPPLSLKG